MAGAYRRAVLATKIYPPRIRPQLVHRQRLLAKLEAGSDRALTLLCAPAGFGKTTLLVDWLNSRVSPRDRTAAVAWLSLDASDNDPVQFLRGVVMALRVSQIGVGTALLETLGFSPPPPLRTMMTVLVNDLVASGRRVMLVLEDYQVIQDREVHDAVAFLLEKPAPHLKVIIVTREDPPLPLSRLRVHDGVCELRAADLRFVPDEVTAFVQEVMGRRLSAVDLAALSARTEGWIGGLQLILLSMPLDAAVVSDFIARLSDRRDLFGYLTEEVLSRQSPSMVSFLLRTSVLDRLSVPLCAAVLAEDDVKGTRSRLDHLEQHNLFLVPLDDERRWYRYHHLFADLLRAQLRQTDPSLFTDLHRRASEWYEAHGFAREAVEHALAAPDVGRAARLVGVHGLRSVTHGEARTVLDWYQRLPVGVVQSTPGLSVAYAYALVLTNQPYRAEALLETAEQHLPPTDSSDAARGIRGRITLVRALAAGPRGEFDRSVVLAAEAYHLLPEHDVEGRAFAQVWAAGGFLMSGDVTASSEAALAAATAHAAALGFPRLERVGLSALSRLYMFQGRLHRAALTLSQAEETFSAAASAGPPMYYFTHGELLREWDELGKADGLLQRGVEYISAFNLTDGWTAVRGYGSLARLRQARGDSRGATAILDAFAVVARQREMNPHLSAHAAAVRAHLWLMQGNYAAAARWAAACGLTAGDQANYLRETEYCALARVLIAQKSHTVLPLLDTLLRDAESKNRVGSVIQILVLVKSRITGAREPDRSALQSCACPGPWRARGLCAGVCGRRGPHGLVAAPCASAGDRTGI